MKCQLIVAMGGGLAVLTTVASTSDMVLWRGETRTVILHDADEFGPAPAGLTVVKGVAKEVKYIERPYGTHYSSFADRVVWGSGDPGLRVLSVTAAADMRPGDYYAGTLRVRVLDRTLPPPREWKYVLDLWQHPWAVARYFHVEPFSPAHYAAMEPLWRMLADAGQKALTVTITDRPWNHQCYDAYGSMVRHVRGRDGGWTFDYRTFDEYVAFGRRCGIGPDIACYTLCPWDYAVSYEDEEGDVHWQKAVPGTGEFESYWGAFLVDFEKHLEEKGWLENASICMDERSPEDLTNIFKFLGKKAPRLKISLASYHPPSQYAGITVHNASFALDALCEDYLAEAAARRAKGMRTTYYVCCGPRNPNTLCHNEIEESFWLGVYPAMCGLDGFLRWAWNSWPRDPFNDATFNTHGSDCWGAGDTYLVYPDGSPSLRFLELRNGIVAAEKLRILKTEGGLPEGFAGLVAQFDRKKAMANESDFRRLRNLVQEFVNGGRP